MTDCVFCRIGAGAIPVPAIYQDETCFVFADANPQAPVHLLVIPKAHFANAGEAPAALLGLLLKVATSVGEKQAPGGYRIVANTGRDGGQTVEHVHLHVLGGRALGWPPG